jgi:hypothetical protein
MQGGMCPSERGGMPQYRACLIGYQRQDISRGVTVDLLSMYLGPERRNCPRDQITAQAVIWRDDPYSIVICTLRDRSSAGAGVSLPERVSSIPAEFDLTFDRMTHRCIAVWQHLGRMGLAFKST